MHYISLYAMGKNVSKIQSLYLKTKLLTLTLNYRNILDTLFIYSLIHSSGSQSNVLALTVGESALFFIQIVIREV